MEKTIRKRRSWRRLLTLFLALAMLAAYVPAAAAAGDEDLADDTPEVITNDTPEVIADDPTDDTTEAINEDTTEEEEAAMAAADGDGEQAGGTTGEEQEYVLNVATDDAIGTVNENDKTNGEKTYAGTDKAFTIIWRSTSKTGSSSNTWDDGYSGSKYISLAAITDTEEATDRYNGSVKFTTDAPATVGIWWRSNEKEIVAYSEDGTKAGSVEAGRTKNNFFYDEIELASAGTFYLGSVSGTNSFYKISVKLDGTLTPDEGATGGAGGGTETEGTPHVLDASTLVPGTTDGVDAGGAVSKNLTFDDGYFTLQINEGQTKVGTAEATFTGADPSTLETYILTGGAASTSKSSIKFTTESAATVKVWWVANGSDGREMQILPGTNQTSESPTDSSTGYVSTLTVSAAGTYYLGGTKSNKVYRVEVTETSGGGESGGPSVTEPTEAGVYILNGPDLEAFDGSTEGQKKNDGDTTLAGTDNYFTLIWSAGSKVDSNSKSWDDGTSLGQRINFGNSVGLNKDAIKFTTTAAKTQVKIWWVSAADGREIGVLNHLGIQAAASADNSLSGTVKISVFELNGADTYYIGGIYGKNYIFKVEVREGDAILDRAAWSGVPTPTISDPAQKDGKIEVTATGTIGTNLNDRVTVTMSGPGTGSTARSESQSYAKTDDTSKKFEFTPTATGVYYFTATGSRYLEAETHVSETKSVDFLLPLAKPAVTASNVGGGSVKVDWDIVPEATKYKVTIPSINYAEETERCVITITPTDGLVIGTTYEIKVQAIRGEGGEDHESDVTTVSKKVEDVQEIAWSYSAFGPSISAASSEKDLANRSKSNNGTNLKTASNTGGKDPVADRTLDVWSLGGSGKIQPENADGMMFVYTKIDPSTQNFVLRATAHVNNWYYSNGQDGFGLMASDSIGTHRSQSMAFFNSYMALVSKVEYKWDGVRVTDDASMPTVAMNLGVGAQEKAGIDNASIAADSMAAATAIVENSSITPLETSYAAELLPTDKSHKFNIVGNYTNAEDKIAETTHSYVDFEFILGKDNTGYFVGYVDPTKNYSGEEYDYTRIQYYQPDLLSKLNGDAVYVGFFASRYADITFNDISFELRDPADDPPPQDRPTTLVTPSFNMVSATISNTEDYTIAFYGNADGTLVIKNDNTGETVYNGPVTKDVKLLRDVKLSYGTNSFSWIMTPTDKDLAPYKRLSSYSPVNGRLVVKYASSTRDVIYVSPKFGEHPAGTKSNPMNIAEAVKIAAPGQTIVLLEGTYNLYTALTIERGVDGTAEKPIMMMADPEAATRPVIDFNGMGTGMTIAGNYWHFYGFDVTNSRDGDKGIQVSGNYNVLERICTYRNGNTGIQISRYKGSDTTKADWPSYNLILNCSSWFNADKGYEDADGFAAKLTVGDGNVFDGCIAAYNADDGWDLFAKAETGPIGMVTIQNSVAFKNGYIIGAPGSVDKDGNSLAGQVIDAGNGNGFKMGGQSITGKHRLINSVSFGNKAKGIDSNSCPDIQVSKSTSFNNEGANVAFYTTDAKITAFKPTGIVSYKDDQGNSAGEDIKPLQQATSEIYNDTNYYFMGASSSNISGALVARDWFEKVDMTTAISVGVADNDARQNIPGAIYRNADGSINMNGFLALTEKADTNAGARLKTTAGEAPDYEIPEETNPGASGGGAGGGAAGGGAAGGGASGGATGSESAPATTVKPAATVSGTTASSTITDSMSSQIVEQAEKNKSASVVIEPQMPADVTKADVTIPGKTLSELNEKTSASVTVKTPAGEVTLPHKALQQLGGSENVSMSVETHDGASTVEIKVDGQNVDHIDGGIKVAVPLKDGQVVVIVDENGNETILPKSIVENGMAYAEISGSSTIKVIDNAKSFNDVQSDSWFGDAVAFVASHDLFSGVGDGSFDPDSAMNRGMLATVLWRLESKANAESVVAFSDVPDGEWYSDGIRWAGANGIVKGMDDGTFAPEQAVTREGMAVMLYRYAQAMGMDVSARGDIGAFSDSDSVSDWAKTEMEWAVGVGLLRGDSTGLTPGGNATRAQVATIIQRFVELIVK